MWGRRTLLGLVVGWGALTGGGLGAAAALGADSVYWTDFYAGRIEYGNLDGTGSVQTLFSNEVSVYGLALDPAVGRIYWAIGNALRVGNLDGTGSPQSMFGGQTGTYGMAIDPVAGTVYWANPSNPGAILAANLDGTGVPRTLFSGENGPQGVTIDPGSGKIYWVDSGSSGSDGTVRVGKLDGTGSAQSLFTGEGNPFGVAVDPATGKIYWTVTSLIYTGPGTSSVVSAVRAGNLDGTGTPQTLFSGATPDTGVAIDPGAARIYWGDPHGGLHAGNLNGSGSVQDLFAGSSNSPMFLSVLRAPSAAAAPQVNGGSGFGSVLSCSRGDWGGDFVGGFFYRAPRAVGYQWSVNGSDIAGATASSFTADAAGSYTCRVTASNQAGASSQTSAVHVVNPAPTPPVTPQPVLPTGTPRLPTGPPRLGSVGQLHPVFAEGDALATISRRRRRGYPVGTVFSFTLNEPARVTLRFTQSVPGRIVKGRCLRVTKKNRRRRGCTRAVTVGTLSFNGHAGLNRISFQGRLSSTSKLRPGRYALQLLAVVYGKSSVPAVLHFRIVKG